MISDIESMMLDTAPAHRFTVPPVSVPIPTVDPLAALDAIEDNAPKGKRKTYPVFPDKDGTAADLVSTILPLAEAKTQLETANKMLGEHVTPFYFRYCAGKADAESSVRVESPSGAVLVTFKAQAKKMTSDSAAKSVAHILGAHTNALFRSTFDLKIDGDEIPAAVMPNVIAELVAVFTKFGCTKALKKEKQFVPYPSFYTQRNVLFTPEQNMEIHRAIPIITSVKSKGID